MPPISYLFSNMLDEGKGTVYGGKKNGQKNDREEVKGRKKKANRRTSMKREKGERLLKNVTGVLNETVKIVQRG